MSTLFLGGDIITMTDRTAEAVVAEDGRIVAVGKADELRARYPDAEVRDLGGRTLMPGFVDAHGHFAAYAMSLLQLSLRDARDMRTLLDSISGRRASTPEGGWVDARDYDPSKLSERRDPTLEELDSACPDRPLCLHHVSGHLGLFNSVAMRTLGVDSYRLEEGPFISAIQGIPMGSPEDIWHAFMEAQGRFASYGITTAQEALIKREMVPLVRPLIDSPEFWIDILGFADAAHRAEVMDMLGIPAGEWRGHLKVKGVKILLDGSPQGGTAWMAEPYLDGHNGSATTDPTDLRRYLREAAELGLEVAVHCNGDAACRELVAAAEEVGRDTGLEQHVVMIHAQFLTPDLMDRMKGIGMEPSFFVSHSWYWGDLYVELFGRKRMLVISLLAAALMSASYFFVSSLIMLFAVRFLHGMCYGLSSTCTSDIVAKLVPPSRRGEGLGYFFLSLLIGFSISLSDHLIAHVLSSRETESDIDFRNGVFVLYSGSLIEVEDEFLLPCPELHELDSCSGEHHPAGLRRIGIAILVGKVYYLLYPCLDYCLCAFIAWKQCDIQRCSLKT